MVKDNNKPFVMSFELEKETPGTYRYKEMEGEPGVPPVLATIYVKKWALGSPAPEKLTVTLAVE